MKKKIDADVLEKLSDEDIKILIENIDLDILLEPIKKNGKYYSKYVSKLGMMRRKSDSVKRNLPGIVLELYKKYDLNYRSMMSNWSIRFSNTLMEVLKSDFGIESTNEFTHYETSDYINLLCKLEEQPENSIDLDIFFLQLKLEDIILGNDIKQEIKKEWQYALRIKEIKNQNIIENEQVLQEQKIMYNDQIVSLKSGYDKKITELNILIQSYEKNIQEGDIQTDSFLKKISSNSIEIESLKKDILEKEEEIKEMSNGELLKQQTAS